MWHIITMSSHCNQYWFNSILWSQAIYQVNSSVRAIVWGVKHWSKSFQLRANKQAFGLFTAVIQRLPYPCTSHSHRDKAQHDFNCLTGQKRSWFLPDRGHCCAKPAAITRQTVPYHRSQVSIAAWYSCWGWEQQQKRVYNTTPGATVPLCLSDRKDDEK